MSYSPARRRWSDSFIPEMKRIVGPCLLEPSSFEVDTEQAADLVVMRARDMMIACRVRSDEYLARYPWDITIRSKLDSGVKTEFNKIVEGWGDWLFYGHEDPEKHGHFRRWFLIDLHEFRAELIRDGYRNKRRYPDPSKPIPNGDGSHFLAYNARLLPKRCFVSVSHDIPRTEAA